MVSIEASSRQDDMTATRLPTWADLFMVIVLFFEMMKSKE